MQKYHLAQLQLEAKEFEPCILQMNVPNHQVCLDILTAAGNFIYKGVFRDCSAGSILI